MLVVLFDQMHSVLFFAVRSNDSSVFKLFNMSLISVSCSTYNAHSHRAVSLLHVHFYWLSADRQRA